MLCLQHLTSTSEFHAASHFAEITMVHLVRLRCSDVPRYLRDGDFYKNLDELDDEEFCLLKKHFKADTSVVDAADVDLLLSTLRFWGSISFPESIISFLINRNDAYLNRIVEEYGEYFPIINTIHLFRSCKPGQQINTAIENGSLELVQYFQRRGHVLDASSFELAAKAGSVSILKFIYELGHFPNRDATKAAAGKGHLHCLHYLHSIHCPWHKDVGLAAAANGHADCLQFLLENGHEPTSRLELCKQAARNGHPECLHYLLEGNILNIEDHLVHWAADSGNVRCLQVAYNYVKVWPNGIQHTIIYNRNLECFVYSITHGCRYSAVSICSLANLGLLQHLKYIYIPTLHCRFRNSRCKVPSTAVS